MRAIMVMYDSLNRHMLKPYGCDWVSTPNFQRLAEKAVTFDNSYVGSMPCMPARRELHTGRYNFLHRNWGPLEPFDDSMPEILKKHGVYTHLISDHYHYWEDGGATYHTRYSSWEIVRGQEIDPWKGRVKSVEEPNHLGVFLEKAEKNRWEMDCEDHYPQTKVFDLGLEFLKQNVQEDSWFVQIETFDPHEPYFVPESYLELYPDTYQGARFDWPPYAKVTEGEAAVGHVRNSNAALITMCDRNLGRILDFMDQHDMWKDTLLIVNTDHGFLLGEHDCWAKCVHPLYNEVAHTPLFIWDPRNGCSGERRNALVQTIDLAPTLLDFFEQPLPKDMLGIPLGETIRTDKKIHDTVIFGMHGGQMCITDGRYVYMKPSDEKWNGITHHFSLMPMHMRESVVEELAQAELESPFSFTKGCPVLKFPAYEYQIEPEDKDLLRTLLFDLDKDPNQLSPYRDKKIEQWLESEMVRHLDENDAPQELYQRLGLGGSKWSE